MIVDLSGPFRGSAAVAAGLLTWGVLRGPRYRRLFPDVYAPGHLEVDLQLRVRAAAVLVGDRGVVAGYSAAELLDASCGPAHTPAEVLLAGGRDRNRCAGLRIHRDRFDPDDVTTSGTVRLTTPVRTAFDLARWAPTLTERVTAVDTLAHRHRFSLDEVLTIHRRELGSRNSRDFPRVMGLADRRAESPMESRIRLALVLGGLPGPEVQYRVRFGRRAFRLDLAYPDVRLAVEYDGSLHRSQERAHRDLDREAILTRSGWKVIRFDSRLVLRRPDVVLDEVATELQRRGRC